MYQDDVKRSASLQVKENCWVKKLIIIDDNKLYRIKNASADENEVIDVTELDLETLMPWILTVKIFEFKTVYCEEIAESIVKLLLQIQNRDADISELCRRLEMSDVSVNDCSI